MYLVNLSHSFIYCMPNLGLNLCNVSVEVYLTDIFRLAFGQEQNDETHQGMGSEYTEPNQVPFVTVRKTL